MIQHPRLQMVFNTHQRLLENLKDDWRLPPVELFNRIVAADPSDDPAYGRHKKLYSDWLLRQIGKGTVTADTLPEVTRALRLFLATPGHGDLNRFRTAGQLIDAVLTEPRATLGWMLNDPRTLELWQRLDGFPEAPAARVDFALDQLLEADPSGGRHLPHLLRWLAAPVAALLPEDLPRVKDNLQLYTQNRQRIMPAGKRDLALCATATDLAGLVQRFEVTSVIDTSQRRNAEDLAIHNNLAVEVADTPDFRLIHLTTKAGAQALGKGTKWCTSWGDGDGKQNHFDTYKDGLLYLRSKHDDSVYQLHFGTWMLNDAQDRPIPNFPAFCKKYPDLMEAIHPHALPAIIKIISKKSYLLPEIAELCKHQLYASAAATAIHTSIPKIMGYAHNFLPAALSICQESSSPPPVDTILTALTKAAKGSFADRVLTLLEFCDSSQYPCHKQAVDEIADKIISTTLTNAAKQGCSSSVMTMLNFCEESSNPLHKPAADQIAGSVITTTLAVLAKEGHGEYITDMLRFCDSNHNPLYKQSADQVANQAISIGLTKAAKHGWGHEIVSLLNFCESSHNSRHKLATEEAAAMAISRALTSAKQNDRTDDLTVLLTFCKTSPNSLHQKAALDWQATQERPVKPRSPAHAMV